MLLKQLPSELNTIILNHLYKICPVSFAVLSYVDSYFNEFVDAYMKNMASIKPKLNAHEIAACGYLNVLQWAWKSGCSLDAETCSSAAFGGHLSILMWLRDNDCPWDE